MMRGTGLQRIALCADDALLPHYRARRLDEKLLHMLEHEADLTVQHALHECLYKLAESKWRREWMRQNGLCKAVQATSQSQNTPLLQRAAALCES